MLRGQTLLWLPSRREEQQPSNAEPSTGKPQIPTCRVAEHTPGWTFLLGYLSASSCRTETLGKEEAPTRCGRNKPQRQQQHQRGRIASTQRGGTTGGGKKTNEKFPTVAAITTLRTAGTSARERYRLLRMAAVALAWVGRLGTERCERRLNVDLVDRCRKSSRTMYQSRVSPSKSNLAAGLSAAEGSSNPRQPGHSTS